MLRQKHEHMRNLANKAARDYSHARWASKGQNVQQLSYDRHLADLYRESLYKFEEVAPKIRNFNDLEDFVYLRINHDRAKAFLYSCFMQESFKNKNDPCFASIRSVNIMDGQMADFLSGSRAKIFEDTKQQKNVRKRREALFGFARHSHRNYYEYVARLNDLVSEHQVNKALSLNAPMIKGETDLRKFDTNYNGKLVDGEIVPEARRLLDHQSFGRTKAPIFGFVVAIVGNTFFVRYCGCRKSWFVNAISRTTLSFHLHIQIQMETHTRHRTMDSKALN